MSPAPVTRRRAFTPSSVRIRVLVVLCVIAGGDATNGLPGRRLAAQTRAASLRIVVVEGEAAINIVQQKTAVSPVIEVRDRNNQPVAGAVVRLTGPVFAAVERTGATIRAGGGGPLFDLVATAVRAGLSGLETLAGIPGTACSRVKQTPRATTKGEMR